MNVFLISLLIVTLALANSFANVVPSNEEKNLLNESTTLLETSNLTSTHNETTLDMTEALAELLTAYKKIMPCGNASLGVPPTAPFRNPSVKLNFSGEFLSVKGEIDNLVIDGLDDFLIVQLAHKASLNHTEMDILYKNIQILGKFNLTIGADLAGFKYVQPLEGFINFQVLNMRTTFGMNIGQNEVGGIQFSNFEYTLQVGDIVVNNLNTKWSVAVNNFANQYIRDFSMLFLQTNREMFGKMYSESFMELANKALYNVPYSYLGSSIVESVKLLKSMECKQ
ncbi:uncharacterized protein LOC129941445 [Eupeodes corollae]|uniref:uncharacterized protein LOC129941445 n=1 Tax=Eupeodes corollae TaxID=290404 RepID=UPI002492E55C|nr:uncharacterized protein LOC129941445 [Eupeodes corollae]